MRILSGGPKVEKSLAQILTTALIAFSLAILFISGSLLLGFHFKSEMDALSSNQRLIAEGAKNAVGGFIAERIQALEAAACLNNPDTITPDDWRLVFQRLLGMETAFRSLSLESTSGQPLAYVYRFSSVRADPYAGGPGAIESLRSNEATPVISPIYIDPKTSEPLVFISVTVFNALKEPRARLTAELNLKFMWALVDQLKVGRTGYAYVADQNGYIIAFGDTARVLKGENIAHLPVVGEFLQNPKGTGSHRSRLYKGLAEAYVVGTYVPLNIAPWVIVAEMPWQEAYRGVIRTSVISTAIILLTATLAALLGRMLSRRLAIPITDLEQTAARIARGERDLQAQVAGPTEVAHLASAFNSMASQLIGSLNALETQFAQIERARAALEESEKRLRLAQEGTTDGIWDWNIETDQAYFSPRWYQILGYEPDAFPASLSRWHAMVHQEDRAAVEKLFSRAIVSREAFTIEYRMLANDDQWRWVLSRGKVVETATDGRAVRVAGSLSDITRRKKAEAEAADLEARFLQAQKMESIGRLAGGVAHDFNNMLSVILGRAELALMRLSPSDPFYKDFNEILMVGHRSAALISQLLGFARKQMIEPKAIDLNQTIEGMLGLMRRLVGENIDLFWKPASGLWPVKMDPVQIDQLIANLMVNARDAIADVGKVTIETYNTHFDLAYCKTHPGFVPGDFVALVVSDNGCGIDKASLPQIFEPFYTTKPLGHGTGLGLATVYGIVKQNNGFINAYSEPEKGTTFKLYIPRHHAQNVTAGGRVRHATLQTGQETVLLVEDAEELLAITTAMLEELGYRVLAADGPLAALRLFEAHEAPIDLLVTDVIMPDMNGRELHKQLCALDPNLKCLFVSGYTANVIAHQGILEEGLHFLNKPFSIQELGAKLRIILDTEGPA